MRRDIINPHTIEKDISRGLPLETANNPERCGFAAPTRTQQCEEFFVIDIEIYVLQNILIVKRHRTIHQANQLFGHLPPSSSSLSALRYARLRRRKVRFFRFTRKRESSFSSLAPPLPKKPDGFSGTQVGHPLCSVAPHRRRKPGFAWALRWGYGGRGF
jgi:hypothetical protein